MSERRSPITGKSVPTEQYIKEWRTFIQPLEKKYDLVVLSYDPDIRAARKLNKTTNLFYAETVNLPLWFVKQLIEVK